MSIVTGNRKVIFKWIYWFMLFNWLLAMGIGIVYLKATKFPDDLLAQLFLLFSFPAHFFSISFLSFLSVLIIGSIWPKRRLVVTVAVTVGLVMSVILIIDAGVYSLYRFHLNGMVWNLITSGVAVEVLSITWVTWATFLALIAGIFMLEMFFAGLIWRHADRLKFGRSVFFTLLILFLAANFIHAWADYVHYTPITRTVRTLPAFKPITMKRRMMQLGFVPLQREAGIEQIGSGSGLLYPVEQLQFKGAAKQYNLMVIVIDSWRFDMIGPEVTPHIWQLASQSTVYGQHSVF